MSRISSNKQYVSFSMFQVPKNSNHLVKKHQLLDEKNRLWSQGPCHMKQLRVRLFVGNQIHSSSDSGMPVSCRFCGLEVNILVTSRIGVCEIFPCLPLNFWFLALSKKTQILLKKNRHGHKKQNQRLLYSKNHQIPWTPKPWKMKVLHPQYMGYNP